MKIAVFSDTHLGFQPKNREEEAYSQALSALKLCIKEKADAILLVGDLFDEHIPSQETWHEAFRLFSHSKKTKDKFATVFNSKNEELEFLGIPTISIHGTHEFRGKSYKNALQVLESAGFILYLQANHFILEKENEKIAVHGLGGVPEKVAKDVLSHWNPKPVKNMKNLMLLHQSFKEFLPFDDEMVASLSMSDLPSGFDLFINGHIHFSNIVENDSKKMLLTGSTVITQMKQLESTKPKLVHFIDSKTLKIDSKPIPNQRKFYFVKIKIEDKDPQDVVVEVEKELKKIKLKEGELHLIKVKIKGKLSKGFKKTDLDFEKIENLYKEKALLYIDSSLDSQDFQKTIMELKEIHKNKKSVSKMGLELLEKNLAQTNFKKSFNLEELFSLLVEGENDKAIELLTED